MTEEVGTVQAAEAAVEGVPGAVSLAPAAAVPALGGELVLPLRPASAEGDLGTDSVRAGLLQAGPLAIAGLLANGANVIATVLLARLLTTRGYGELNVLSGLFLIVSMPGSAVIVAVVRRVTAWKGAGSAHLVQRWARRMHRWGTIAVLVFAAVVLAAGSWLAGVLNQRDVVGVEAVLVAGAVWILLCLDRGLLQAHRNYRALSANLLVEGGVRTVAMLSLVAAGLGPSGAAAGLLVAELATAVHARILADRVWAAEAAGAAGAAEAAGARVTGAPAASRSRARHAASGPLARHAAPGPLARHAAPGPLGRWIAAFRPDPDLVAPAAERRALLVDLVTALVALAMTALLQNIDVIVLGREAPSESGSYAAVSVASKALVFGAVVLGGYLLPEAAIRWRQGGHALRQLAVTLLLLGVPAAGLLVVAVAAPHLLLSLVFSSRYLGAESAFLPLVLAMVCLSVTVILTMYLLAVGRRWISVLLVLGVVAATAAVAQAHGVPKATARADLAVQAALALCTVVGFALVHHRRHREGVVAGSPHGQSKIDTLSGPGTWAP